jgi:hypothetical protein
MIFQEPQPNELSKADRIALFFQPAAGPIIIDEERRHSIRVEPENLIGNLDGPNLHSRK